MKQKLLGYYNYTVILTYIGMLTGFLGIVFVMEGNIHNSLLCLMAAGLCDMFDGAIAATRERTDDEKCFGIQIDSLSDLICFGVLPSLIVLKMTPENEITYAICSLYVLCALIRLAYFNVSEQNRQRESSGSREVYYGLPVTTIALSLPLFLLLCEKLGGRRELFCGPFLLLTAVLFLSPFSIRKPKILGKLVLILSGILGMGLVLIGLGDI